MFSKVNSNSNNNQCKPFCKVCHDAGKPDNEVTSHFVKSLEGKIICPTLLTQNCRYCKEPGHTVSFCKVLAQQKKLNEKKERKNKMEEQLIEKQKNTKNAKNTKNIFTAFMEEDDEEEEETTTIQTNINSSKPTYASIASKPKSYKQEDNNKNKSGFTILKLKIPGVEAEMEEEEKPDSPIISPPKIVTATTTTKKYKSWADYSSSEDEEEDEGYKSDDSVW
jgi:hypothetical protein